MTISDNTILAENLGDLFRSLGKKGYNASKKLAKNVSKNPGRTFAIKSPKTVLSTIPNAINFHHGGKSICLEEIAEICK